VIITINYSVYYLTGKKYNLKKRKGKEGFDKSKGSQSSACMMCLWIMTHEPLNKWSHLGSHASQLYLHTSAEHNDQ